MRSIFLSLCFLLGLAHTSFGQEPNTEYHSLECIEIVDPRFESVLDSVFTQDSTRHYFQDGLTYTLYITKYEILGEETLKDGGFKFRAVGYVCFSDYMKGILQYKGHDFILCLPYGWEALDSRILKRTGRYIKYPFVTDYSYIDEQGRFVIVMGLDDTIPYRYIYHDDEFEYIPYKKPAPPIDES